MATLPIQRSLQGSRQARYRLRADCAFVLRKHLVIVWQKWWGCCPNGIRTRWVFSDHDKRNAHSDRQQAMLCNFFFQIRTELEQHMNCNLKEYKEFIDNEMLLILGQMD
ncbi:MAG: DEK C-terminal domain-containing protein, partial [Pseudomonadota bacterium]